MMNELGSRLDTAKNKISEQKDIKEITQKILLRVKRCTI